MFILPAPRPVHFKENTVVELTHTYSYFYLELGCWSVGWLVSEAISLYDGKGDDTRVPEKMTAGVSGYEPNASHCSGDK